VSPSPQDVRLTGIVESATRRKRLAQLSAHNIPRCQWETSTTPTPAVKPKTVRIPHHLSQPSELTRPFATDISPRHRSLSPSHALSLAGSSHIHSAGSSGTTLVADLDDEKKKLADILAVRDAHRLEIQAQLMSASARDAGERVPWDTRGGAGAGYGGWDAPGRGSGRGVPVAGWDPGDGERDARY